MTADKYRVRALAESDLEEWFKLRTMLWDASSGDDHKAEILDIMEHPDTQLVVVAELDTGDLAGFLEASIRSFVEDCHSDHVGFLEGWFVQHKYRKMGIGRALVGAAELWARSKGCVEMASDTEIGNESGIAAHESLGYLETSRLVHLRKDL